ncbi:reverse transcriptase family protein [Arthrobacter sp. NPDC057388]|uniref:reverse transcriptase family protein n=1 Tax=Arthrobacter sp. NPDC057388 TaxID=3346116 RepID=UPI00363B3D04
MYINKRPVPSLEYVASEAGVSSAFLRDVAERRVEAYNEFTLAKAKKGSTRIIASPLPDLAKAQRWILSNMLRGSTAEPPSFAYRKSVSVKDCARVHVGARWVLKLDLRDFFHSIDVGRVAKIFRKTGCDEETSRQLARLCTRSPRIGRTASLALGYLPQGAPTSGMLANLAASNLDRSLSRLGARYNLKYTRYSDDLTFSSSGMFSRTEAHAIIRSARAEIVRNHFQMNEDKIRISPPGSRLMVLGLLVDTDRPRLRGNFKKDLEWHVYGSSSFGPNYSVSKGFTSLQDYISHVDGLFAHAIDIEPEWAHELQKSWAAVSGVLNSKEFDPFWTAPLYR